MRPADRRVSTESTTYRDWWRAFNDPVLDRLVARAYRDNLTLQQAGVRVLQARAQLGIAVGEIFPQTQQAIGSVQYNRPIGTTPTLKAGQTFYEGPADIHVVGRNASNTAPARFVVVFLKSQGGPHPHAGERMMLGRAAGRSRGRRRRHAAPGRLLEAYPSSSSRGSLHAVPVKLTPNGVGFASKPSGNGGVGAFGDSPKGTITVG